MTCKWLEAWNTISEEQAKQIFHHDGFDFKRPFRVPEGFEGNVDVFHQTFLDSNKLASGFPRVQHAAAVLRPVLRPAGHPVSSRTLLPRTGVQAIRVFFPAFFARHKWVRMFVQGILKGKYHCTVDLLFDWFGISYITNDNFGFYLQNRPIQTSKTGG
jgi:hypothetical protein